MAASLLTAIGLPELIAENTADFERLAVKLAREPALLESLRQKLAANRKTMPLFDTLTFTRNLEVAYEKMQQIWQSGEAPASFAV